MGDHDSLSGQEQVEWQLLDSRSDGPDINALAGEFGKCVSHLSGYADMTDLNHRVRHAFWPGQDLDSGRKTRKARGSQEDIFPWENASDLRVFAVDELVNVDKSLLCESLRNAQLAAVPSGPERGGNAAVVGLFMRWLVFSQMEELEDEAELLADYMLEKGAAALQIVWEKRVGQDTRPLTLAALSQMAESLAEQDPERAGILAGLADAVLDAERANEAADVMGGLFPNLSRRRVRKVVTELRNSGQTMVPVPDVVMDRPSIRAFAFDVDLIMPPGVRKLQDAPYLFQVDWFSPEQLREKILTAGWDQAWVERVIKGAANSDGHVAQMPQRREWLARRGQQGREEEERLVQVVCAYWKASDEDNVPGIHYTVFHDSLTADEKGNPSFAFHGPLGYKPARYPFVEFGRERITRRMLDSRGYPETGRGFQDELKVQRDSRIDRASLSTLPPMEYTLGREPPEWGPGRKIPVKRRGEYGFAEVPKGSGADSREIDRTLEASMLRYYGRPVTTGLEMFSQAQIRHMVMRWLSKWKLVFRHVWQLWQQFGPPETFFRVVGGSGEHALVLEREVARYDFWLDFDTDMLDAERMKEKLNVIGQIAERYGRQGEVRFDELLRMMISTISPVVAERIIAPVEEATQQEAEAEMNDLTKIWSGMDVDVMPGVNADLRLGIVQQYLEGSQNIPATDVRQRLEQDEAFRARIEKHMQQLQHQLDQRENAVTGRLGAKPGNMGAENWGAGPV